MAGIENTAAQNIAKAGRGGNISPLVTGLLTGKYLRGRKGAEEGGYRGKSGVDWYNENLAKDYEHQRGEKSKESEFGRQGTRRGWMQEDVKLPNIKNATYDTSGTVSFGAYAAPVESTDGPKRSTPSGTSGVVQGKQFKKSRPGSYKDTRSAVAGGHITPEEAVQISPTYAKKVAEKATRGSSAKAPKAPKAPKA